MIKGVSILFSKVYLSIESIIGWGDRNKDIMTMLSICMLTALLWKIIEHPIIPIVLCALPIGIYMVFKLPFYMVLMFIVFSFFRIHEVFPFLMPLKLPLLLALGSLVSISWGVFISKSIKPFYTRELAIFSIFFMLVFMGMFLAKNPGIAIATMTETYMKIAIMVFSISWMATNPKLYPLLFRVFCLCGIIVGSVALYNKANGLEMVEGTRVSIGRSIGSMLGDPNDLSLVLLFPAGFALALLLSARQKILDRLLGLSTIIMVFLSILATQSRGGLLGIVSVCGIFGWYKVKNKALLITAGMGALLVLFAVAGISDRQSGGAHEEGIDESAMGRIYAWGAAFRMAVANPLNGVGINNFYYNYYLYSSFWDGKNHAVHSTWFGVLGETGFVGFFVFCAMVGATIAGLVYCVRTTFRIIQDHPEHTVLNAMSLGLLAAFTGFCVSGTFLTMGFTWPLYIIMALAIAIRQTVLKTHEEILKTDT